jgi:microcystin-dependent protein
MSAINTGSLNVNYPEPGVNNNSQGFRDNFSAIKNNLDTANSEISDLQNKAVLKSALSGTTLDNDMDNTLISNALTRGFRSMTVNLGNDLSGSVVIDFAKADLHQGTITGDTTLSFVNWPKTGTHAKVQVLFKVGNPTAKITFPENLDQTISTIENYAPSNTSTVVITPPADIDYLHYVISTENCGETIAISPVNRSRKTTQVFRNTPAFVLVEATGKITTSIGSTDAVGSNASFSSEMAVGKKLYNSQNTEIGIIKNILSNNLIKLQSNAYISVTNGVYKVQHFSGTQGDSLGAVCIDDDSMYVCTGDYDGESEIWSKVLLSDDASTSAVTSIQVKGGTTGLTFTPDAPITTYGDFILGGTLKVDNGGTGVTSLTGYVKGSGSSAFTATTQIPMTDLTGTLTIAQGGTGSTTNVGALNNLLPDQEGSQGLVLGTDGTNVSWVEVQYELPIATSTVLGGIKVDEETLSINSLTGVLSAIQYELPTASTSVKGGVIVDGTTVTVTNNVLSATQYVLPTASTNTTGGVKVDGTSVTVNQDGILSSNYTLPVATTTSLGGVKVDGTSISINSSGVISATQLQPTAATENNYGVVRVDGTTIKVDDTTGAIYVDATTFNPIGTTGAGTIAIDGHTIINDAGVLKVANYIADPAYATTTTKGPVKIDGSSIDIDSSGVISVAPSALGITGEIKMWPTNAAPSGYLMCNGAAVSRTTYAALFAVIGTLYGAGDNLSTFNLPDFRNRMPLGSGDNYAINQKGGSTDPVLVSHTHTATVTGTQNISHGHTLNDPGHTHDLPSDGTGSGNYNTLNPTNNADESPTGTKITTSKTGITIDNATQTVEFSNASVGISTNGVADIAGLNMPPYLGINFIIKA